MIATIWETRIYHIEKRGIERSLEDPLRTRKKNDLEGLQKIKKEVIQKIYLLNDSRKASTNHRLITQFLST